MRNIAISLSYDGTNYHGWQIQENLSTVQGTLLDAVKTVTKENTSLIGCGRTDTGVHARRYIASFKTECTIPIDRVAVALNSILPRDIAVKAAHVVPDDFHPIRSCVKKEYTYEIYKGSIRNPFLNNYAYFHQGELDTRKLKVAASHFVGEHDFASMRSLGTEVKSTVRRVFSFDVIEENDFTRFVISANGFLYNMARTMVGTLLAVNAGKIDPDDIPEILKSGDRSLAGATAPAQGLYMTDVVYPQLKF